MFKELTEGEGLRPAVLLAQLRDYLSCVQARGLITDKTDVKETWEALDRRYGDRELAVINAKYQLLHLDTTKGQPYKQVEALQQGVTKSLSILRSVDAESEFLNDLALIAQLVAKFPQSWQERWHLDRTGPSFKQNKLPLGQKFVSWLDRQSEAANSARLTQMSLDLEKQMARGAEIIKCGKCSKAGHRTGD